MLLDRMISVVFLISGVSSFTVPPPENVTVSCQNVDVAVNWDYIRRQPQTTFMVNVIASTGKNYEDETTDHHYDLSHFVWQSEEDYMSLFYVTVTAKQGGLQSEAIKSQTFSFNDLKTVETKCVLDFPPISVNADDEGTSVKFQNPLHIHKYPKKTIKGSPLAKLKFVLSTGNNGEFDGICEAIQPHCKSRVTFPEGVEQCVTAKGWLFDSSEINYAIFRETQQICGTKSDESLVWVATILGSIFVAITILVVIAICKVKAWMMNTKLPMSLDIKPQTNKYDAVPKEKMDSLSIDQNYKTPSVKLEDNSTVSDSSSAASYLHTEMEDLQDLQHGYNPEVGYNDWPSGDSDDEEEEEEKFVSPYNAPHHFHIDMAEGDMATGNTG